MISIINTYRPSISKFLTQISIVSICLIYTACSDIKNSQNQLDENYDNHTARIAFVSDKDGAWDIWVMNPDGSELKNITKHSSLDSHPSWSPSGENITFYSDRRLMLKMFAYHSQNLSILRKNVLLQNKY